MEINLSFFLTILSVIGGILGVIWWIRRVINAAKLGNQAEHKLDTMDTKLGFIIQNQRQQGTIMAAICECVDEINLTLGRPKRFEHPPIVIQAGAPPEPTEIQEAQLLQEIQETLYQVNQALAPMEVNPPPDPSPCTPKDIIRAKVQSQDDH